MGSADQSRESLGLLGGLPLELLVSHAGMDYMYHHGKNPLVEEQIMEVVEGKGTLVDFLDPMYDEEWYYHRIASI